MKETRIKKLNYKEIHLKINNSQDEYGTAAYKTVELDTYLDDKPVQHREVENHESDMFRSERVYDVSRNEEIP